MTKKEPFTHIRVEHDPNNPQDPYYQRFHEPDPTASGKYDPNLREGRLSYYRKIFRHTTQAGKGDLPKLPIPNAKDVLLDYFETCVKSLGTLKVPLDVQGDYPDAIQTLESVGPSGSSKVNGARGISVVRLDGTIQKFIGNELIHERDLNGELIHSVGWLCKEEIEVDYWSTNSRDRDFGTDLVMSWLLEFIENCDLTREDFYSMEITNYYDSQSQKPSGAPLPQMNALHYGVIKLEVSRIFYGTYAQPDESGIVRIQTIDMSVYMDQFGDYFTDGFTPDEEQHLPSGPLVKDPLTMLTVKDKQPFPSSLILPVQVEFRFSQMQPQQVWTVRHQLPRLPSVTVCLPDGSVVRGTARHLDAWTLSLTFPSPVAGYALLF